MERNTGADILVRDARLSDLDGLSAVSCGDHPAIRRDRLHDADGIRVRYLVAQVGDTISATPCEEEP